MADIFTETSLTTCELTESTNKKYIGKLQAGEIHWGDGDIWVRYEGACEEAADGKDRGFSLRSGMDTKPIEPADVFAIFVGAVIPNIVLLIVCSTLGYGSKFYNFIAPTAMSLTGDGLLCGSVLVLGLLYILSWEKMSPPLKLITGIINAGLFFCGSLFKGRRYCWAPMLIIIFPMPLFFGAMRILRCSEVKRRHFYLSISGATSLSAFLVALAWVMYIFNGNEYTGVTKARIIGDFSPVYEHVYPQRALNYTEDCGPNRDISYLDTTGRADLDLACSEAANVWFFSYMCPMVAIGCDLVVCVFCLVTGALGNHKDVSKINRNLMKFFICIAFCLAGLYATSAMAATSIRVGNTILAFCFTGMSFLLLCIYVEVDVASIAEQAKQSPIAKQLQQVWQSDWTKAFAVAVACIPMMMFFLANLLKQKVQIMRGTANDPSKTFTPAGERISGVVRAWSWTPILVRLCFLCELFFTFQVGVTKITYVFLSWMNAQLQTTSLGLVLVLMFIIGNLMFLLPPVPGLPVYVFGGILIGEKGYLDPNIGIWGGCVIATALCLATKMTACTGQYMIGYFLGKSVKVQQLIGVDKVGTRAIEQILKTKGLNPEKVSILVGGPDWPTSVTCGIIGVNIPQMLLGTIPVLALLAPCVLAGAFLGRVTPGESDWWSTGSQFFTALAALINAGAGAYAVYAVSETVKKHGEELAKPRPEHAAVAELTEKERHAVEKYNEVCKWTNLETVLKFMLSSATVALYFSNFFFVVLKEYTFRPFAVSSDIEAPYEEDGLNGDVFSIVLLPVGLMCLILFFFGVFLHLFTSNRLSAKAKAALRAGH
jgi:hypothetical protein